MEEEVEIPVSAEELSKESAKMDTDDGATDSSKTETDVNMEDAKTSGGVDNGGPESKEKSIDMETDKKVCKFLISQLHDCCLSFNMLLSFYSNLFDTSAV